VTHRPRQAPITEIRESTKRESKGKWRGGLSGSKLEKGEHHRHRLIRELIDRLTIRTREGDRPAIDSKQKSISRHGVPSGPLRTIWLGPRTEAAGWRSRSIAGSRANRS
jgi:hypothetical protein